MKTPLIHTFLPKKKEESVSCMLKEDIIEYNVKPKKTLIAQIREGFPMAEFVALQELLLVPEEELGRYLGISPATLHRRKKSGHLETPESERIVRFARLFGFAMEVLDTEDAAREWLKASNPGTAGEAPLTYADTEYGAREVENLLGQLDYGVFS